MGGGASKSSHNDDCTSNSQQQQKVEDVAQQDVLSHTSQQPVIPKRSPRADTQVQFGNNHEEDNHEQEEHNCLHSSRHHQEDLDYHPSNEEDDEEGEYAEEEEEDTEEAMQLRMLFAQSAMSMDMDNEDLIFNLLYFGGDTSNFASMMNNAAEETVAAHSAGNTPYKLTPATEMALQKLKVMTVTDSLICDLNLQECSICQEEMEVGHDIAEMPGCRHCFHNECVLKWFALQSWCPVCRTKILPDDDEVVDEESNTTAMTKMNSSEDTMGSGVKSNLGALFNDAADDRVEEVH